jgi:bifunctional ADP-heptose synthase (sugar kinase/adenylyltransferase)
LARLLDFFGGLRDVVVGDFGLDHYLVGDVGRISREYPVTVRIPTHERDEYRPGGAANTVTNLVALGATVVPVGPIETDPNGDELLKLLARTGCDLGTVVRNPATSPRPASSPAVPRAAAWASTSCT